MTKKIFAFAALAALLLSGCAKEIQKENPGADEVVITATATAPGAIVGTKVAFTDNYSEAEEISDITAVWEVGDTFTALEINGNEMNVVTFSTEGSGATATFKSKGAVAADENTKWIALSGEAEVVDGVLVCKYSGQDGSLANLDKFDYTMVQATGAAPVFDFSKGTRLSFVIRLLLPAGIKHIEFNTGETNNGGWNIQYDGKPKGTKSTCERPAVTTLELKNTSAKKDIAYIAVPAISYAVGEDNANRTAGLIITIMSPDKRLSQGKVTSAELSQSGGCVGTYDMSELELMARPLPEDAIKLGTISYGGVNYALGSWAPFNVGGDVPTSEESIRGGLYAWGETEPRNAFTRDNYKWCSGGTYNTHLGYKYICAAEMVNPYIVYTPAGGLPKTAGPGTFYDIGGTKYDVARVKWGIDWRIPDNVISGNILKAGMGRLNGEIDVDKKLVYENYDPGTYKNSHNYTSNEMGALVIKANGAELALYLCPFTDNGSKNTSGTNGRYWTATTDYGTGTPTWWNRAVQLRLSNTEGYVNNKSWIWDGLSVRAVLNE
ncbi:MAG: hypothetical protein ACOXZI_06655 [Candidatus Cryptobacteroides sp.]|jgi:hypothetical protein